MRLLSIFLGITITAVLLAVIVLTRMMVLDAPVAEYEVREVEIAPLPDPSKAEPEVREVEDAPRPKPAMVDLLDFPEMSQPSISVSNLKIDPSVAIETFFTDQAPSPLPKAKPKMSKPKRTALKMPKFKSPPRMKSQYSLGELDQKPRLLRNPSVMFPRSIRNASIGKVVVKVCLLPSGKSQFLSVVSSTHPELISAAKKIANGSLFTQPTRQGKPVRAVMTWPITIKK